MKTRMTLKAKMEKMVFGGQCLGRSDEKVVFAWNALPGEEAEILLSRNKKNFAEGTAINISNPSPYRIQPKEEHFEICSPWQIMTWAEENRWKKEISLETYVKIGGLPADTNLEIEAPADEQYHYRNKIEYSFALGKDNNISLAFFERGQHRHLALPGCDLAENGINETANIVLEWINQQKIPLRTLKSLVIRSNNQKQTIAALFIKDEIPLSDYPNLTADFLGFHVYFSSHKCPASKPEKLLYSSGQDYLIADLNGTKLKYGLLSFFQINIPVFKVALDQIASFLDPQKNVVDYYSGVGAIGLPLIKNCKKVELVDNNSEAIEYAKDNILLNNLSNAVAELCPAEKITDLIKSDKIIIFDPPRTGLHEDVIKKVLKEKPERVVYLSCNISTHARDIKMLCEGYKVVFLKLYNFFPRTPHVESLCVLERL